MNELTQTPKGNTLNATEAAKRLNVSVMTVTRWFKAGIFENAKQGPMKGSEIKIPVASVEAVAAEYCAEVA